MKGEPEAAEDIREEEKKGDCRRGRRRTKRTRDTTMVNGGQPCVFGSFSSVAYVDVRLLQCSGDRLPGRSHVCMFSFIVRSYPRL